MRSHTLLYNSGCKFRGISGVTQKPKKRNRHTKSAIPPGLISIKPLKNILSRKKIRHKLILEKNIKRNRSISFVAKQKRKSGAKTNRGSTSKNRKLLTKFKSMRESQLFNSMKTMDTSRQLDTVNPQNFKCHKKNLSLSRTSREKRFTRSQSQ